MRGLNIHTDLSLGGKLDNSTKKFNTYPIYRNSLIKVLAVFRYVQSYVPQNSLCNTVLNSKKLGKSQTPLPLKKPGEILDPVTPL